MVRPVSTTRKIHSWETESKWSHIFQTDPKWPFSAPCYANSTCNILTQTYTRTLVLLRWTKNDLWPSLQVPTLKWRHVDDAFGPDALPIWTMGCRAGVLAVVAYPCVSMFLIWPNRKPPFPNHDILFICLKNIFKYLKVCLNTFSTLTILNRGFCWVQTKSSEFERQGSESKRCAIASAVPVVAELGVLSLALWRSYGPPFMALTLCRGPHNGPTSRLTNWVTSLLFDPGGDSKKKIWKLWL